MAVFSSFFCAMDATWPVWISTFLPIVGISTFLSGAAVLLLPRNPARFFQVVAALLLPWILLTFFHEVVSVSDTLIAMVLSVGITLSTRTRHWPLFLAIFSTVCILTGSAAAGSITGVGLMFALATGTLSGGFLLFLEQRFHPFQHILHTFQHEMEYRRQAMHLTVGVTMTILLYYGILHTWILGALIPVAFLMVYLVQKRAFPLIERILLVFERQHHFEKFPGRGSICFLIGGFLATLFFPTPIALASILILAFGDSLTNIAGAYFGRFPLPYNKKKNIEGPAFGALIAAIAASIFVPFPIALLAALCAMVVETIPMHIAGWDIDDNITIPLVAGVVMLVFL